MATLLVFVAIILDGADGWAARKLHAQSEFGKVLDSLSDIITFGAAPAYILYEAVFHELSPALGWGITILFPVCGALRLARFNVQNGMKRYFVGLPIPAAGGMLALLSFSKMMFPSLYYSPSHFCWHCLWSVRFVTQALQILVPPAERFGLF